MDNFDKIHAKRLKLVKDNKNIDHIIFPGSNRVMLSSPHGVSQVRLGKYKFKEVGSLATAIYLHEKTNSYLIAKTKNNFDDANFDEKSAYKDDLLKFVTKNNIKYVIDFHGLAEKRDVDVNVGTNLGQNIAVNERAFEKLYKALVENGFKVSVDQPFMGGAKTISGFIQKNTKGIFSLQIEINCAITNKKSNFNRFELLLNILTNWINDLVNQ